MCDVGADGRALFSLQLPGTDWVLLLLLSSFFVPSRVRFFVTL